MVKTLSKLPASRSIHSHTHCCSTSMTIADWSELADDLVGEIAKNIACVEDFLLFSRVCPSWRSAAVKENWVSGRQLPWLALAEKEDESTNTDNSRRRGFFNLNKNKRYDLTIPQTGITRSWGSSVGCIVTVNLDLEIHIINPLSGLKLNLPHLYTLKHMPKNEDDIEVPHPNSLTPTDQDYIEPMWFMCKHIIKAILCKKNEQLFVAVIYGGHEFMAIARPGDQSWTEVERKEVQPGEEPGFQDVVFFNDQHYAVTYAGRLVILEFDWLRPPKCVTIVPPYTVFDSYNKKVYLVESSGDLLMVARCIDDLDDDSYTSMSFDVYKFNNDDQKWIELKNLGDMALFIGDSYSVSLCSSDVVGCESNVIYYTDDYKRGWDFSKRYGGHDMGVFNLKGNVKCPFTVDKSLEDDDLRSSFSCPVWMIPNLF